jgi:hypothetical protein
MHIVIHIVLHGYVYGYASIKLQSLTFFGLLSKQHASPTLLHHISLSMTYLKINMMVDLYKMWYCLQLYNIYCENE